MPELMISREDAAELKREIDALVDKLAYRGFERVHIGGAMAGVGLAIHYANGGDFEKVVAACRLAIEQKQAGQQ